MIETAREPESARRESFPCDGPIDVDVRILQGRLDVRLGDEPVARVTLVADPAAGASAERALAETSVDWSARSGRLVVRTPRSVPLNMLVEVPEQSRLSVHAGSAAIDVCGTPGRLSAQTGSGDVSAEAVDGPVDIKSGSGHVRLGPISGTVRYRAGSGRFEAAALGRESRLATGSGDISVGLAHAGVVARTGSGDVRIGKRRRETSSSRRGLETSGSVSLAVWPPRSTSSRAPARRAASSTLRISGPPAGRPSASRRGRARARLSSPGRTGSVEHAAIPPGKTPAESTVQPCDRGLRPLHGGNRPACGRQRFRLGDAPAPPALQGVTAGRAGPFSL